MGPILNGLVNLQEIELQLRNAKKRLKKAKQAILRQQHQINQLNAALAAKREEIKLTKLQTSKLELELKASEDEINKLRLALNTAKTNKDYSAILTRINTDKADKAKLEEQILALMTQIEADQAECREIEESIEKESGTLKELNDASADKQQAIQTEIDDLAVKHSQALAIVPDKERVQFGRWAERFDGEVLAFVVIVDAKRGEHSCGGCYMAIPLELVNSLMSRDEVVNCPSCGRILILNPADSETPRA